MIEARLAVIRSPEVASKIREIEELRGRLSALIAELADLQKGKLVPASREATTGSAKLVGSALTSDQKRRRPRVSKEDAHNAIVEALACAPEHTLKRTALADITGLAKPKIDERIKFNASRFVVGRGPSAMIKLLPNSV